MTGARPGRRRDEASRHAILETTFELLKEDGFERLSIEGVAARAGVGKATIYRWWAGKGVLAVEAFLVAVTPMIAFRDTGSASDDIVAQMQSLAKLYRGPTGGLVRQMIGSSQHDPAMRRAFVEGFLTPRRAAARAVIQRGLATGEFREDLDPDLALDALYGPLYYRLLASGAPIDVSFVTSSATLVLRGIKS